MHALKFTITSRNQSDLSLEQSLFFYKAQKSLELNRQQILTEYTRSN